jgi:hypothetical protein
LARERGGDRHQWARGGRGKEGAGTRASIRRSSTARMRVSSENEKARAKRPRRKQQSTSASFPPSRTLSVTLGEGGEECCWSSGGAGRGRDVRSIRLKWVGWSRKGQGGLLPPGCCCCPVDTMSSRAARHCATNDNASGVASLCNRSISASSLLRISSPHTRMRTSRWEWREMREVATSHEPQKSKEMRECDWGTVYRGLQRRRRREQSGAGGPTAKSWPPCGARSLGLLHPGPDCSFASLTERHSLLDRSPGVQVHRAGHNLFRLRRPYSRSRRGHRRPLARLLVPNRHYVPHRNNTG